MSEQHRFWRDCTDEPLLFAYAFSAHFPCRNLFVQECDFIFQHMQPLQSPDLQESSSQPAVSVAPISDSYQITVNMDNEETIKK